MKIIIFLMASFWLVFAIGFSVWTAKEFIWIYKISREKIDLVMMVVYIFSILSVSIAMLSEAILFIIA